MLKIVFDNIIYEDIITKNNFYDKIIFYLGKI